MLATTTQNNAREGQTLSQILQELARDARQALDHGTLDHAAARRIARRMAALRRTVAPSSPLARWLDNLQAQLDALA